MLRTVWAERDGVVVERDSLLAERDAWRRGTSDCSTCYRSCSECCSAGARSS
jgi:hypothetical protein